MPFHEACVVLVGRDGCFTVGMVSMRDALNHQSSQQVVVLGGDQYRRRCSISGIAFCIRAIRFVGEVSGR